MARYDVYANPEAQERARIPYLLDLQNDYISGLATRVVIPLRAENQFGRPAKGLNPVFLVQEQAVVLDTAALGALPAHLLRKPILSLRAQAAVITAALDTLFGSF
ncbi:toxin CcdB [Inhella inkyongensis]|uniref:Toxin CcdB n=1 Tax=Inhella inkyongensis TaxID=392593 RepID=A0A840S915_9BURK|nr:CcdB family protein [Inhella inkyongensis]MBB5205486.1 toxin CcdB [Inhella inkyongensis]